MDNEDYQLRQTIKELLSNLCTRIDDIVELYRLGENNKANERMVFFTDDVTALSEGMEILKKSGLDVNLDELNTKLKSILDQFENEDYLFVSDLFKYELKPLFQYWQEEIGYEQ